MFESVSVNQQSTLELRNLTIAHGERILLENVGFEIIAGQVSALMGASGSGKSLSALALQGALPANLTRLSGEVLLNGRVLNQSEIRANRGKVIANILQNPRTCFNPLLSMQSHIKESLDALSKPYLQGEVEGILREVGLESTVLKHYAHELSGGMLQRVMIAIALLSGAEFIIADEATTDLDKIIEAKILRLLREVQERRGVGILLISHDRAVVESMADRIYDINNSSLGNQFGKSSSPASLRRMSNTPHSQGGRICQSNTANTSIVGGNGNDICHTERSEVSQICHNNRDISAFSKPQYDKSTQINNILQNALIAHNVSKSYTRYTLFGKRQKRVLAGVHLRLNAGECVALLGASGSGKSTLARAICALENLDSEVSAKYRGENKAQKTLANISLSKDSSLKSCNDFCHTERSEVSQQMLANRDISAFSKPQFAEFTKETSALPCFASEAKQVYDKKTMDCYGDFEAGQNATLNAGIYLNGREITQRDVASLQKRREFYSQVQILFQDPISSLNPRLTLRKSLAEPLANLLGIFDTREQEARILPLLERLRLDSRLLEYYPAMLSGGQAARFCLARALLVRPRYVVLDEATSGLDEGLEGEILDFLGELREEAGLGVLLITHNARLARRGCERIYIMQEGEIIEEALASEPFVSDFGVEIDRLMRVSC